MDPRGRDPARPRALLLAAALAVAGCATNPAPPGWLPGARESTRSAYGGWIRLELSRAAAGTLPREIEGEFLAVGPDSFVRVLTGLDGVRAVPLTAIGKARLTGYDVEQTVGLWTFPGVLLTAANGWGAVLSMPIWVLTGTVSTHDAWNKAKASVPRRSWSDLSRYARFPQGWPPGADAATFQADERWPRLASDRRKAQRRLEKEAAREARERAR